MQRLTLRDPSDNRFLARIVDRDGFAFVLDFGDANTIADASRKVAHGFTLGTGPGAEHVPANSADILEKLALHYLHEGLDVSLDKPAAKVHGRVFDDPDVTRMAVREARPAFPPPEPDEHTEQVTLESVALEPQPVLKVAVAALDRAPMTLPEPDEEDEPTELVPEEMRLRALDADGATQRHSVLGDMAAAALNLPDADDQSTE
jgi:hypothetical protein